MGAERETKYEPEYRKPNNMLCPVYLAYVFVEIVKPLK